VAAPSPNLSPVELTVEPPTGGSAGRFTVWVIPFGPGDARDYLMTLAGLSGRPGAWEREQCRRLAERIVRWDVRRGGRVVEVSPEAVRRLPAWAFPQLEAMLFGETQSGDDDAI
jgi:hypothetical protein